MSLQPINSPTTWKRAQTSINANFTALVNALAGEGTVDATDPAVTALLTDDGSGAYAAVEGIAEDVADAVVTDAITPGPARVLTTGQWDARGFGFSAGASASDNAAAIATAVSAMSRGDTLHLPQGQYTLDPVSVPKTVKIAGAAVPSVTGQYAFGSASWASVGLGTVLRFTNTTGAAITADDASDRNGFTLEDLLIIGPGSGDSTGLLIGDVGGIGYPVRVRMRNVQIANFKTGLSSNCENSLFDALFIMGCGTGLHTFYPFNGNTFLGINVERCSDYALRLIASDTNAFYGGVIQGNTALNTVSIEGDGALESRNNKLDSIYFENTGAGSTYYDLSIGEVGTVTGTIIDNCHIDNWSDKPNLRIRFGAGAHRNEIRGGHPLPPVLLASGSTDNYIVLPNGSASPTDSGRNTVDNSITGWTSYTPTWSASGDAPSLGNGTLVGRRWKRGKTVHYRIKLTYGSTTTGGTGTWRFSLPYTPHAGYDGGLVGTGYSRRASNETVHFSALHGHGIPAGLTFLSLAATGASMNSATTNAPAGAGDILFIAGSYESA